MSIFQSDSQMILFVHFQTTVCRIYPFTEFNVKDMFKDMWNFLSVTIAGTAIKAKLRQSYDLM